MFLEVTSQELTQADAARKWGVDVSTVIRLRAAGEGRGVGGVRAAKPGRMPSPEQAELEAALGRTIGCRRR